MVTDQSEWDKYALSQTMTKSRVVFGPVFGPQIENDDTWIERLPETSMYRRSI